MDPGLAPLAQRPLTAQKGSQMAGSQFRSFLKANWLGIIGVAIGLAGIAYSVYTTQVNRPFRELTFAVDPGRVEILSSARLADAPIQVLRSDGTRIDRDLVAIRFYFWNSANTAIRREHVLEPITVILTDANARILKQRVVSVSRAVTNFNVHLAPTSPRPALLLDFAILEPGDGAACEILVEGNAAADLDVRGVVEGIKAIRTARSRKAESLAWGYLSSLSEVLTAGIVIILLGAILLGLGKAIDLLKNLLKKLIPETARARVSEIGSTIGAGVSLLLLISFLVFVLIVAPLKKARQEIGRSLVDEVPAAIRSKS